MRALGAPAMVVLAMGEPPTSRALRAATRRDVGTFLALYVGQGLGLCICAERELKA